jgi:hypothetical protein
MSFLGYGNMNFSNWLYNDWFIAIFSIVLGVILQPALQKFLDLIRSLFGEYSGVYIAITGDLSSNNYIIELIRCFHIGEKIFGNIYGISFIEFSNNELIEKKINKGIYSFSGKIDNRLFLISYQTLNKNTHGSGALTLLGENSGRVFNGIWTGHEKNKLVSLPCVWIRVNPFKKFRHYYALRMVGNLLTLSKNPWDINRVLDIYIDFGVSKFIFSSFINRISYGPIRNDINFTVWNKYDYYDFENIQMHTLRVNAKNVISLLKENNNDIYKTIPWWNERKLHSSEEMISVFKNINRSNHFVIAWNALEFGNNSLVVICSEKDITFTNGELVIVEIEDYVKISPEDIGEIKLYLLCKKHKLDKRSCNIIILH